MNEVWLVILTYLAVTQEVWILFFKKTPNLQGIYLLLVYIGLVCGFEQWFNLPHLEAHASFNT